MDKVAIITRSMPTSISIGRVHLATLGRNGEEGQRRNQTERFLHGAKRPEERKERSPRNAESTRGTKPTVTSDEERLEPG